MMQLSAVRETTLSWRVVGPFTEPFLVVDVLYYVLPLFYVVHYVFLVTCGS